MACRVFTCGGGGGVNRAPKNWGGGVQEKGSIDKHHSLVIMKSGAEGAENWSIFFSPNIWQMMTFLNPLDALNPKIPFSFFADFLGLGHLRGPGVSLGRILGVLSIEPLFGGGGPAGGLYRPPPPQTKTQRPYPPGVGGWVGRWIRG